MPKIKAIIFDMDGVLIDARDWHYEALNKALNLFGMEINRYDHATNFDGLPTKKKLEMLSIERGLPVELHNFINCLKQKYTLELVYTKCRPLFTHEYALSRLRIEGYRLVVASNSIRETIKVMMTYARLSNYLDFYLSAEDVKSGKPDPEIYLEASRRLSLSPEECLVIEDNPRGVKAAVDSGAWVMEVSGTSQVTYDRITTKIKQIENPNHA